MNFPTINEELCPTEADSGCLDARCSDPAFTLSNPDICGAVQSLELKPGYALACAPSTLQFSTYLRSSLGEVPLTAGVVYSTSDASIVNIDASTGAATVLSAGVATITATWQGMNAFSQVNVVGGVNCCQSVQVRAIILLDSSNSMNSARTVVFPYTKAQAANSVANYAIEALNEAKDQMALVRFKDIAILEIGLTSVESDLLAVLVSPTVGTENGTSLKAALDEALLLFSQAPAPPPGTLVQPVILLVSDGQNQPILSGTETTALMAEAQAFKDSGGIIVCVGIRAYGVGYTTLQNLSSGGFFLNCIDKASVDGANARMKDLATYYCGCSSPAIYGCYQYGSGSPPGPQPPDPDPPFDPEGGGSPPPPPPPPTSLPCPTFTPPLGVVGAGLDVFLSVPGHPNARIRFTADGSQPPPNPSFTYPPSPLTGLDYDGMNVPIHIGPASPGSHPTIKAIARETGYADSVICAHTYTP